jgi:hypothetical protein
MANEENEAIPFDSSILDSEIIFDEKEENETVTIENKNEVIEEKIEEEIVEETTTTLPPPPPIKEKKIIRPPVGKLGEAIQKIKERNEATTTLPPEITTTPEPIIEKDEGFILDSDIKEDTITTEDSTEEDTTIDLSSVLPRVKIEDLELQSNEENTTPLIDDGVTEIQKKIIEEVKAPKPKIDIYGGPETNEHAYVSSDNEIVKKLKKYNIPIEKIVAKDLDATTDKAFQEQYLNPINSPVVSRRITRSPCLLSGYYVEVTAYNYSDLFSLIRNATNPDLKYLTRFTEELKNIYNHISYTSMTGYEGISFDDWVKSTLMPDLSQCWFGAFDATFPGTSPYALTCGVPNCGHEFVISRDNKELNFLLQKGLKYDFLHKVLRELIPAKDIQSTDLYKEAHSLYEKLLPEYQYKVSYGIPSIMDVLEWLMVFEEVLNEQFDDFTGLVDETKPEHNVLKMYTYIKKLAVPTISGQNEDGRDIITYIGLDTTVNDEVKRMNARRNILRFLNNLPKNIFRELFTGKEVREKLRLQGIIHMLHNIKCPNCGTTLERIRIDIVDTFFTEAERTVRQLSMY